MLKTLLKSCWKVTSNRAIADKWSVYENTMV